MAPDPLPIRWCEWVAGWCGSIPSTSIRSRVDNDSAMAAGDIPPLSIKTIPDTPVEEVAGDAKPKGRVAIEAHPDAELFPETGKRGAEIAGHRIGRKALPQRTISVFDSE